MDRIEFIEKTLKTDVNFTRNFLEKNQDQLLEAISKEDSPLIKILKHAIKEGIINNPSITQLKIFLLSERRSLEERGAYIFESEKALKFLLIKNIIGYFYTWDGYCFNSGIYKGDLPSFESAVNFEELAKIGGYAIDHENGILYKIEKIKEVFN